jgi:anti-sigma B factor antagonist
MKYMTETIKLAPDALAHLCWKLNKESKLKSSLEITVSGGVLVVKCRGRVVYRDEAAALFGEVVRLLPESQQFVLDMSEVELMDGAGLGELMILLERAQAVGSLMKIANPSRIVRELLELTHLSSVLEIYPSVGDAVQSCGFEVSAKAVETEQPARAFYSE